MDVDAAFAPPLDLLLPPPTNGDARLADPTLGKNIGTYKGPIYQSVEEHSNDQCPGTKGIFLCSASGPNETFIAPIGSPLLPGTAVTCTDPLSGNDVTITAYVRDYNDEGEEIGIDVSVDVAGYYLGAVYMKAGLGGNLFLFDVNNYATLGQDFITPDKLGLEFVEVCLYPDTNVKPLQDDENENPVV
jgi:hypothetical protein